MSFNLEEYELQPAQHRSGTLVRDDSNTLWSGMTADTLVRDDSKTLLSGMTADTLVRDDSKTLWPRPAARQSGGYEMKCFVIAMECEAAPVSGALDEIYSEETICGLHIVYGTMCGERMFVMTCGIGKVNAGRGAQYAVSVLGADTIINIGVAGGLLPCMKVAAMYGVSGAVQYDFDLTQINGTPMGTLNECTSPILPLEKTDLYPSCIVGSGDRFNDDPKDFQLLTKELGAGIRDMELGAIAQVCMHTGTRLYSFKAISDVAGQEESTPDQYSHNQALCFETEKAEIRRIVQVCV